METGEKREKRILPSPDTFAVCPYEGVILDFYRSQFDSVYVLLHPFIRAVSINSNRFCPESYPSKSEILAHCAAVTWTEVVELSGLADINEVDIGLRTGIAGLKVEFEDKELAAEIDKFEEAWNVIRPNEGDVPELIQNRIFETLQQIGQEWLWVGDEFCTERKLEWIDDLKGDYSFPSHCNVFTPDKSILLTTHWDSHFSFLCSSRQTLEEIVRIDPLEGFFCDEMTEVYWSLRSPVN